jgi:hypothetical protein
MASETDKKKWLHKPLTVFWGFVLAVATSIVVQVAGGWIEPDLRVVDGPDRYWPVRMTRQGDDLVVVFTPTFKNFGIKPGRIDRVDLIRYGRSTDYPERLYATYVDKTEIGARSTKEVRCEFVASYDTKNPNVIRSGAFTVVFYDATGRQVASRNMVVGGPGSVDPLGPSTDPPRR